MTNPLHHPAAAVWPTMDEPDLRRLADDIKSNGLQHPIVMHEGKILDGRNRHAACGIAGVEPTYVEYEGDDPIGYVLSSNNERRHMSLPERAAAVALTLASDGNRENGRWKRGSVPDAPDSGGSASSGWQHRMKEAGLVLDQLGTDPLQAVAKGERALDDAYREATTKRDQVKVDQEKIAGLPGDLAALVSEGVRSLDDAVAEAEARAVVGQIDEVRNLDGAPAPSFSERAEIGSISWAEARQLAEQWKRERDQSLERDSARLRDVATGWATVQLIASPDRSPGYVKELRDQAGRTIIEKIDEIITEKGTIS